MVKNETHPTVDKLAAFSSGQLPMNEAEHVESHIEACSPCCETLMGLTADDTFVGLLRETRDPVNASTMGIANCADTTISESPRAALANHPRYEIVELIAKGGMGEVFKAKHRMMDRMVALKVIKGEFTRNAEAVERFHREVKTAAHLSHPNIVTAYDAEQADGVHFLVMEHVDGQNLADVVQQHGKLSVTDACEHTRQVAVGLQHAHEEGMVHRDMKPHNLMLTNDGTVKILDFGLASLSSTSVVADDAEMPEDASLTAAGSIMGTPDFISPEQATDAHQADIRSDIYSLGATLYHLLAGQPPFAEGSVADRLRSHAQSEPTPVSTLREDVPDGLNDVISRMMAKDPAQRFQTPQQVADALAPFVDRHRTKTSVQSESYGGSVFRKLIIAACAAAAVIAMGILYIETDKGTLRIESDDDSVEVVISNAETTSGDTYLKMNVLDTVTGTQVKRLRSGDYTVSLGNKESEFQLSQGGFTLTRGGDVIVRVTRKPQQVATLPPLTLPEMAQDAYFTQGSSLSVDAAKTLQDQADADATDIAARLQLLGFYSSNILTNEEMREPHRKLVMWLIRNYPDSHAAASSHVRLHRFLEPEGYVEAKNLWLEQAKNDRENLAILKNAASFLAQSDVETAQKMLETACQLAPQDADVAYQLGSLYVLGLMDLNDDARSVRAKLAMTQFEIAVANDDPDYQNPYLQGGLAKTAFHANEFDKAKEYANQLLELSTGGKAISDGNMVLGLVALQAGDVQQAKSYLLASAKVIDGPNVTISGPNMLLAKALLESGEKELVLEFFDQVRKFWKKTDKLDKWTETVKKGEVPNFGANLAY